MWVFDWRNCWHGERQADVKALSCGFPALAVWPTNSPDKQSRGREQTNQKEQWPNEATSFILSQNNRIRVSPPPAVIWCWYNLNYIPSGHILPDKVRNCNSMWVVCRTIDNTTAVLKDRIVALFCVMMALWGGNTWRRTGSSSHSSFSSVSHWRTLLPAQWGRLLVVVGSKEREIEDDIKMR